MDIKKIEIIFVTPQNASDESECSDAMSQAYKMCKQNSFNVKWMKEENCENIKTCKTIILVFQSFEGKCFDVVKESKAIRIVGPWCLLTCIIKGCSIPNFPWPVLNVAMLNCIVACSNISKKLKDKLRWKIQSMGGQFTDALMAKNTHLITDSVKSEKYLKAADANIKIMLPSWLEEIWIASHEANVHADDEQFNKHICPPFHKLVICSTGFTNIQERKEIEKLVTENGATYSGQLHVGETDVLVCKNVVCSEKYKVARKAGNIQCVTFEWITDSIKKGYALPENLYCVKKGTSTPTKDTDATNPNFSMISAISTSVLIPNKHTVDETVNVTELPNETSRKRKSFDELTEIIDGIDVKSVKQAGTFLDGCNIYLIGFTTEQKEKLCKVLNFSGATRYDDISERITHIIVGDHFCHEYKIVQSKKLQPPVVNIKWLMDSIKYKHPISEENYIITESSSPTDYSYTGSPLSKKSLQFLKDDSSKAETETNSKYFVDNFFGLEGETDILQQYLKDNPNDQQEQLSKNKEIDNDLHTLQNGPAYEETTNTLTISVNETEQNIFEGLKFLILGFDSDESKELKECIKSAGGEILGETHKDVADYIVHPVFNTEIPAQTAAKVATDYWITECIRENEIRDILYYHKPYCIKKTDILQGCVITISSYTQYERAFLINLIQYLGAISQEQLARVKKDNILATTHLLSCEASGKKYKAAVKWKIPVISKDWLLECAMSGVFIPEIKYIIGDRTSSSQLEYSLKNTPLKQKQVFGNKCKVSASKKENIHADVFESLNLEHVNTTSALLKDIEIPAVVSSETETCEKMTACSSVTETTLQLDKSKSTTNWEVRTPLNRIIRNMENADTKTPVNSVNKIMQEVRMLHGVGTTPITPKLKGELDDLKTPDTPYGAFIRPNPSPHLRKVMLKWINDAPDLRPRRDSTPLSELKRQLWNKLCQSKEAQDESKEAQDERNSDQQTNETSHEESKCSGENENAVAVNLQQLQDMLTASGGNRKYLTKRPSTAPTEAFTSTVKNSQPCTIGWDYMDYNDDEMMQTPVKQNLIFMISGVDVEEKTKLTEQLQNLGAIVSDLTNYDPACTHMLSTKAARSEKLMSAMAAGKWILHLSYVEKSAAAGKLLDEEEFEYGNPKFVNNVKMSMGNDTAVEAIHWWRKEIQRRGYGAFHDMRAIIVATKRDSLVRVIEAGGGMVIEASPPFKDTVFATHCVLDIKAVPDLSAYIPLAKQGIYCVPILYINNFLQRTVKDVRESIIPYFSQYY